MSSSRPTLVLSLGSTLLPSPQPSRFPASFQISESFQAFWDAGSYLQGNRIPGGPGVRHNHRRPGLRERSWSPENRSAQEQTVLSTAPRLRTQRKTSWPVCLCPIPKSLASPPPPREWAPTLISPPATKPLATAAAMKSNLHFTRLLFHQGL